MDYYVEFCGDHWLVFWRGEVVYSDASPHKIKTWLENQGDSTPSESATLVG